MLSSYLAITPEILLILLAAYVLVYGRKPVGERRRQIGIVTAWGTGVIMVWTLVMWLFLGEPGTTGELLWGGMFRHDMVTLVFRIIFLSAVLITSLISIDVERVQHGEYFALILLSAVGFTFMAAAGDIIMLYLALETVSISYYVLAGFATESSRSPEAGMKYFVYGAFASGVMLYGLSLLYGFTAQTGLTEVARGVASQSDNSLVLLAAIMVIAGFGFKVAAVPFHFWSPDVYEGAPTPVTAILSTASKAAGFAIVLRLVISGALGVSSSDSWWAIIVAMAIASMTLGNLGAIYQKNLKRLLAYSGVAQAGYLLVGVAAAINPSSNQAAAVDGAGSILFYLLMYVFTNIAAFAVIILVSQAMGGDDAKDLSGLSYRSPFVALVFLFALLSLGGIPPTAGFFGKLFIFKAAVDAGLWWLALIGVLNAFVALYYYLSVAKYAYLYRGEIEEREFPVSRAMQIGLALATLGILYLGIAPGSFFDWTRQAAAAFFTS